MRKMLDRLVWRVMMWTLKYFNLEPVRRGYLANMETELTALARFTESSGYLRDGRPNHPGRHAERKITRRMGWIRASYQGATRVVAP